MEPAGDSDAREESNFFISFLDTYIDRAAPYPTTTTSAGKKCVVALVVSVSFRGAHHLFVILLPESGPKLVNVPAMPST